MPLVLFVARPLAAAIICCFLFEVADAEWRTSQFLIIILSFSIFGIKFTFTVFSRGNCTGSPCKPSQNTQF